MTGQKAFHVANLHDVQNLLKLGFEPDKVLINSNDKIVFRFVGREVFLAWQEIKSKRQSLTK